MSRLGRVHAKLVLGRAIFDEVQAALEAASVSVWVATADLKELKLRGPHGRHGSILEHFDRLAERGVELRMLHAKLPSRPFREQFDRMPRLYRGGLQLRQCPRVHAKVVVVDGRWMYLGSANWTSAGLGGRHDDRRNFEVGVITDDEGWIDEVQGLYQRIWGGSACRRCRVRQHCEAPLDLDRCLVEPERLARRAARSAKIRPPRATAAAVDPIRGAG